MLGLWLLPTCQIVIWLPAPFCQCHSDFIDGSVCCCVGPSGYRCLCYSVTVTFVMAGILFFVPRDKIPVVTDWATVLIWMWQKHILSPHWNFCSEIPGRASVCPPLQSIKRSLNVNILIWNLFNAALVHQVLAFSRRNACKRIITRWINLNRRMVLMPHAKGWGEAS